ncbi:MAG: GIY-YIG nuclease family protein [Verrucomicrobiia bacterium]
MLRSRSGRFYYGSTTDLSRRLEEHRRCHTYTTSRDAPWTLVVSRELVSLTEARALERQFKKWKNPQRVFAWFGR